jgi:hypothetical protein
MTLDAVGVATTLSAALALTGAWPEARWSHLRCFWPVPLMALATFMGLLDLGALVGQVQSRLPATQLVLGIWAMAVVDFVGALEIRAASRGRSDWQALMAPAVLISVGLALLLEAFRPENDSPEFAPGVFVLLAGLLLLALRSSTSPPRLLRYSWPLALLLGIVAWPPSPVNPYAEAGQELELLLTRLRQSGASVVRVEAIQSTVRQPRTPVEEFRVDGNQVTVYLVGHDEHGAPDPHLSPRVAAPPSVAGVPHLHTGPHIIVVCITADPRFASQLDKLVQELSGRHGQRAFARGVSLSSGTAFPRGRTH